MVDDDKRKEMFVLKSLMKRDMKDGNCFVIDLCLSLYVMYFVWKCFMKADIDEFIIMISLYGGDVEGKVFAMDLNASLR